MLQLATAFGRILLTALIILSLFRLSFYHYFAPVDVEQNTADLFYAFYLGLKFDLRLLLFITLLPLLGSVSYYLSPFGHYLAKRLWRIYFFICFGAVILLLYADFAHYAYLETRLNASILRFAYNLDTSFKMVVQTYPVFWLSILVLTTLIAIAFLLRFTPSININYFTWRKRSRIFSIIILLTISLTGIWAKASWYPLRWSDAFHTPNLFLANTALNPALYFYDTLKNKDIEFNVDKARQQYPVVANFLGISEPDTQSLNFTRSHTGINPARKKNIVIVLLESFAWYKTGLSGNPFNPTPHFDNFANHGISFQRYYAPHGGTARSVWALITGLPDLEMNRTSSRNPLIVDQKTVINSLTDYDKYYFIGGSANWANIRGLLSSNIDGLNIYEEGNYTAPRMDVWGISDLHLFEEANKVLDQSQERPFLAIIQTSGNHRPYNIPEDNRGFKRETHAETALAKHGFRSLDDYNAMRFMDHSIGFYMEQAKSSQYYDNTVFVFLADHGNLRQAAHMPAYVQELGITDYQSPLVIFDPENTQQATKIETIASELDVLPTVAAYTGNSYRNTTLGRDALSIKASEEQYAFIISFQEQPIIGLIGKDYYYQVKADGTQARLHNLSVSPEKDILSTEPDIVANMHDLLIGLYESAAYIRYHNKK